MRIIKAIIVLVLVAFLGFQGIVFFFADYGPGESQVSRLFVAFVYYFFAGMLVSWLSKPHGKRALFLLWGVGMVAILNIPQSMREGDGFLLGNIIMIVVPALGIAVGIHVVGSITHALQTLKKKKKKKRHVKN